MEWYDTEKDGMVITPRILKYLREIMHNLTNQYFYSNDMVYYFKNVYILIHKPIYIIQILKIKHDALLSRHSQ